MKSAFALPREILSKLLALFIQLVLLDCQDSVPKQTRSVPAHATLFLPRFLRASHEVKRIALFDSISLERLFCFGTSCDLKSPALIMLQDNEAIFCVCIFCRSGVMVPTGVVGKQPVVASLGKCSAAVASTLALTLLSLAFSLARVSAFVTSVLALLAAS